MVHTKNLKIFRRYFLRFICFFYSYVFNNNYRINTVKEELLKEKYDKVLFHGSKKGLSKILVTGFRNNCDFGNGFYLGETYNQADSDRKILPLRT